MNPFFGESLRKSEGEIELNLTLSLSLQPKVLRSLILQKLCLSNLKQQNNFQASSLKIVSHDHFFILSHFCFEPFKS